MDKVLVAIFILTMMGVGFLMYYHYGHVTEQKSWCTEAGGVPLVGDKGHFKLCLNPDAIIEKPKGITQ